MGKTTAREKTALRVAFMGLLGLGLPSGHPTAAGGSFNCKRFIRPMYAYCKGLIDVVTPEISRFVEGSPSQFSFLKYLTANSII
jgi:hypothetical protein